MMLFDKITIKVELYGQFIKRTAKKDDSRSCF